MIIAYIMLLVAVLSIDYSCLYPALAKRSKFRYKINLMVY